MADDSSVSFWWILLFVLLTLGVAAWAVLFVGGEVLFVGGDHVVSPGLVLPV